MQVQVLSRPPDHSALNELSELGCKATKGSALMKKIIRFTTFYFIFVLTLSIFVQIAKAQEENVTRFNTNIKIEPDGKVYVSEDITYNFGSKNKHGIFRTIPYKKTSEEDKKFVMTIDNISVLDDSGRPHKFTTDKSISSGEITLKIGDPDAYVTGQVFYEISYTVSGALTYFEDHDELYWNFTGNSWEVPIISSTNLIIYPSSISSKDVNSSCFTGVYGAKEQSCQMNIAENGVLFNTTQTLSSGEGISGVVGLPKGVVAVLEPKPDSSWIIGTVIGLIALLAFIYWYVYFPIKTLIERIDNRLHIYETKRP